MKMIGNLQSDYLMFPAKVIDDVANQCGFSHIAACSAYQEYMRFVDQNQELAIDYINGILNSIKKSYHPRV